MDIQSLKEKIRRNPSLAKVNPAFGDPVRVSQPERNSGHGIHGAVPGAEKNPRRFRIRIIVFRNRLIDPDNSQFSKYWIDCLRYAGAIPDDTAAFVEEVTNRQIFTAGPEKTMIEIESLP